jgi:hypothetical protein
MEGKAIDIDTGDRNENRRIFMWASQNLKFTQLINEYDFSWVHISYDQNNLKQEILAIK